MPVGVEPEGMGIDPDEKLPFMTNGVSNDVSMIDVDTEKVVKSVSVGRFPRGAVVKD